MEALVGDSDRVQNVCLCLLVALLDSETEGTIQRFERPTNDTYVGADQFRVPDSEFRVGTGSESTQPETRNPEPR